MTPDAVFVIANVGVLPAWLLLLLAPASPWTQRVVHAVWIPILVGLAYGYFLFTADPPEAAGFRSLSSVMLFFTDPSAMLAGWLHYIVFDLFVGAWEVRDAQRRGVPQGWVAPCLLLTLMLGPLGLLLYLAIRYARTRATGLRE